MQMDWRSVGDVSSFLLIEDTGDSEADSCHIVIAFDDDDAESCSCEPGETHGFDDDQDLGNSYDDEDDGGGGHDHCIPSWSSSCNMWLSSDAAAALGCASIEEGEEASRSEVNISREVMDEMEDRLFWEICMAVGYP